MRRDPLWKRCNSQTLKQPKYTRCHSHMFKQGDLIGNTLACHVLQWWFSVQCVHRGGWREFYSCAALPGELDHHDQDEAAQSQDGGHEP